MLPCCSRSKKCRGSPQAELARFSGGPCCGARSLLFCAPLPPAVELQAPLQYVHVRNRITPRRSEYRYSRWLGFPTAADTTGRCTSHSETLALAGALHGSTVTRQKTKVLLLQDLPMYRWGPDDQATVQQQQWPSRHPTSRSNLVCRIKFTAAHLQ